MLAIISSPGSDNEAQLQCAIYLKNKFGRTNYAATDEQAFRSGQAHIYQRLTQGSYLQLVTSIPNGRIAEHVSILMGNIIKSNINQYCKEHEEQDDDEKFKVINAQLSTLVKTKLFVTDQNSDLSLVFKHMHLVLDNLKRSDVP